MFNLKDLGDVSKIANQAKELQKQQDEKHRGCNRSKKYVQTHIKSLIL